MCGFIRINHALNISKSFQLSLVQEYYILCYISNSDKLILRNVFFPLLRWFFYHLRISNYSVLISCPMHWISNIWFLCKSQIQSFLCQCVRLKEHVALMKTSHRLPSELRWTQVFWLLEWVPFLIQMCRPTEILEIQDFRNNFLYAKYNSYIGIHQNRCSV